MSSGAVHKLQGADASLPVTRREVLAIAHQLHQRGWVANHDGNISVRLPGKRWLLTPTAISKRVLVENDLIVVDADGRVLQGGRRPFSEFKMHMAIYDARPDVRAVVHCHAPSATALSVLAVEVDPQLIAEAVVSLGDRVPMARYHFPNSADALAELRQLAQNHDVVTMQNHGLLGWGDDLEQAFLRSELVEHLATIQQRALLAGKPQRIPKADVARLLEKRASAGLGAEGRRRRKSP